MRTLCGRDDCLGCLIKYSKDIEMCKRERDRAIARKDITIPTINDPKYQTVNLSRLRRKVRNNGDDSVRITFRVRQKNLDDTDITDRRDWVLLPNGELRFNDDGDLIGAPFAYADCVMTDSNGNVEATFTIGEYD